MQFRAGGRIFRMLMAAAFPAAAQFSHPGCPDLQASDFRKVSLVDRVVHPALSEPVKFDVARDGRVFWIERAGPVKMWDPRTRTVTQLGKLAVHLDATRGGMGLALHPRFQDNNWIFVVYHPGALPRDNHQLSRFTLAGGLLTDERQVLSIPLQAGTGNHASGAMDWDGEGNLLLALGDAISPDNIGEYRVDGYAPIHPQHPNLDARRTSGNSNDLNGKILRIHPEDNGAYTVPAGNLFPPGDAKARPEIYSMGHRNPWTLSFDRATGWVFVGDVGPDALAPDPSRGPAALDEFHIVRKAGNAGWPYVGGKNVPYNQYDYVAKRTGPLFDPAAPVNQSPFNTGLGVLPPALPAAIAYSHDGISADQARFPLLGGKLRSAPVTGPVYRYDPALDSRVKLPPHFHGAWFISDWERRWFLAATLDGNGEVASIRPPFPGLAFSGFVGGRIGPEGALYALEYGEAGYAVTSATRISRVEYTGTCLPSAPVVSARPAGRPARLADPGGARLRADLPRGRILVQPGKRPGEAGEIRDIGGRSAGGAP